MVRRASMRFAKVYLIDPASMSIALRRGAPPRVLSAGVDVTGTSALIVRGTRSSFEMFYALSTLLEQAGCVLLDGLDRFVGGTASKVPTTLSRHERNVGSTSFLIGPDTAAEDAVNVIGPTDYPVIMKPVAGSQGRGAEVFADRHQLEERLRGRTIDGREPLLIQTFVPFRQEYRVLLLWGEVVSMAEKVSPSSEIKNAALGATFTPVTESKAKELEEFCRTSCPRYGLLGVDVGETDSGFQVIEENAAPQWMALEHATGVDVAEVVIDALFQRAESTRSRNVTE